MSAPAEPPRSRGLRLGAIVLAVGVVAAIGIGWNWLNDTGPGATDAQVDAVRTSFAAHGLPLVLVIDSDAHTQPGATTTADGTASSCSVSSAARVVVLRSTNGTPDGRRVLVVVAGAAEQQDAESALDLAATSPCGLDLPRATLRATAREHLVAVVPAAATDVQRRVDDALAEASSS